MSCTHFTKAAKPVWAKQLTRLPCLVVYVKFQFVCNTKKNVRLTYPRNSYRVLISLVKVEQNQRDFDLVKN